MGNTNTPASQYVHGTDPAEQARLTRLNEFLNVGSLREMHPRPGERMLEVGSGLGQFARAVARATSIPVIGIERSADQIAEARRVRATPPRTMRQSRP